MSRRRPKRLTMVSAYPNRPDPVCVSVWEDAERGWVARRRLTLDQAEQAARGIRAGTDDTRWAMAAGFHGELSALADDLEETVAGLRHPPPDVTVEVR